MTGTVRIAITADDPTGTLVMVANSATTQHALTIGENEFQVHLNTRSRWTWPVDVLAARHPRSFALHGIQT